jgi:hypothetical protein
MSLRRWNSVAERAHLDRYILISEMLLEEESFDDSSSSDSSMESLEDALDHDVSFLTDVEDDDEDAEQEDDAMSVDVVNDVLQATIAYSNYINCPLLDTTIDFDAPPLKIDDLDESKCILDFRFRKLELKEIAERLWPKMELFLEGTRDKIRVQNRYTCEYETGLLLVLYRLSRPRRIRPEMETYFKMRKSHISAAINTFMDALYSVALPYLSNPSIFQHRFEFYSKLIHKKAALVGLFVWGFIDGTL